MFSALVGLAIGLQTIPERLQCPADHKGRKRVANSSESFSHMLQAAGYPQQRTHRIAARRRIHDILQIVNPAIDRAPRDTRRLLDYIGPSKAVGARLSRHEKSPSSFVENRQHIRVSLSDGLDYVERAIHPRILTRPIKAVNPQNVAGPSFPKPVALQIHLFPQAYLGPVRKFPLPIGLHFLYMT